MIRESAFDASPEEREALFDKLYAEPGFAIRFGNYYDTITDVRAKKLLCDFIAKKIRECVKDPEIAEN